MTGYAKYIQQSTITVTLLQHSRSKLHGHAGTENLTGKTSEQRPWVKLFLRESRVDFGGPIGASALLIHVMHDGGVLGVKAHPERLPWRRK